MRKLTEKEKCLRDEYQSEIQSLKSELAKQSASFKSSTLVSRGEEEEEEEEDEDGKAEGQLKALKEEMERAEQVIVNAYILHNTISVFLLC